MLESLDSESMAWVARMTLGVTFLVSGSAKLRDTDGLAFGILDYQVLPQRLAWPLARPLARLLTFTELALAVLLITGTAVQMAALGTVLLVACFAYGVGVNLLRGRKIPCHCITNSSHERIGWMTLARLTVLGSAAVIVLRLSSPAASVAPPAVGSLEAAVSLVSIALSTTVLVSLMGPTAILWHEVSQAWKAAAVRREVEAEQRRAREELLARRRARRLERRRDRRNGQRRAGTGGMR